MDCCPPGSSVHGISQARILVWVAISFSRDLSNPGIEPASPAGVGGFFTTEPPGKPSVSVLPCVRAQLCSTLRPHRLQSTRLLCPRDFPGKNTGVGCHFLLQGIFPTQGSNPGLLHWQNSLLVSHQGSPFLGFSLGQRAAAIFAKQAPPAFTQSVG